VVVLPRLTGLLDGPVSVVVESGDKLVQVDGIVVSGSPSD
jgi:hypothetical protein